MGLVEQARELAEHHCGGAPHRVRADGKAGVVQERAVAVLGGPGETRAVAQIGERDVQNLRDFVRVQAEPWDAIDDGDDRLHEEVADGNPQR